MKKDKKNIIKKIKKQVKPKEKSKKQREKKGKPKIGWIQNINEGQKKKIENQNS